MNYKKFYRRKISLFTIILNTCLFLFSFSSRAQIDPNALGYFDDAIRFSRTTFSGTARFQGIAGAQTALGGDISAMTGNPAGLGFLRKSEFSVSPGLDLISTTSNYFDPFDQTSQDDNKTNPNIAHFGIVLSGAKDDLEGGKWRGGSFGVSVSRIQSFQDQFSYQGINENTSKTDFFVDITNGIPLSELENDQFVDIEFQRAAYFAFLTNEFVSSPDNVDYFTLARNEVENLLAPLEQSEMVETTGGQYQWSFAYGGNYDDKLYFGASLGITTINYEQVRTFSEIVRNDIAFNPDDLSFLDSFTQRDQLEVRGTGVNLALGVIYRPLDFVRVGASFTSPTLYSLREEFNTDFETLRFDFDNVDDLVSSPASTIPGSFDYRLRTPWRASIGAAFLIGKYGFISADAEYVAYQSMNLRNEDFPGLFDADNATISSLYQPTWNYRIGAEFRQGIFRLRGGFALEGDPFDEQADDVDRQIINITGGLGVRLRNWYADLAVINSRFDSVYVPYSFSENSPYSGLAPFAEIENNILRFVLSAGFYFEI